MSNLSKSSTPANSFNQVIDDAILQSKCFQYFPLLVKFNTFFNGGNKLITIRFAEWYALFFQLAKDFGLHNFLFYDYDHLNNKHLSKADQDSRFARDFLMNLMSLSVGEKVSEVMGLKQMDQTKRPRSFKKLIEEFPCFLGYEADCILLFTNRLNQEPFLKNTFNNVLYTEIAFFLKFLSKFTKDIEYAQNHPDSCYQFIKDLASIIEIEHDFAICQSFFRKYYSEIVPALPITEQSNANLKRMICEFIGLKSFFERQVLEGVIKKRLEKDSFGRCHSSLDASKKTLEHYLKIVSNLTNNIRADDEDGILMYFLNLEIDFAILNSGSQKIVTFLNKVKLINLGHSLDSKKYSDSQLNSTTESSDLEDDSQSEDTALTLFQTFSSSSFDRIDQLSKSVDLIVNTNPNDLNNSLKRRKIE